MRLIADFHIHSKYSRACSKELVPEKLHEWAQYKGIDIIGTGDFTHPLWFRQLEEKLEPAEPGLFKLKAQFHQTTYENKRLVKPVRFVLTSEVATIYSHAGKLRRIHTLLVAPSFAAVRQINKDLANIGNLTADGRPILGLPTKELARIALSADPTCMIIPAHAWTPYFGILGSKSGYDSLEECFEELTPEIFAIETGLSSDPEMNWRLAQLDRISLISCSDAHSLPNLGREATIFDIPSLSYAALRTALRKKDPACLLGTIEFYPEEGKYHYDGHAEHKISYAPDQTKRHGFKCEVCGKSVTVGVMYRVDELANRQEGYQPKNAPFSKHIVPLQEIVADAYGVGKASKKVQAEYWKLIHGLGDEFKILLDLPIDEIARIATPRVVEGITRVRAGTIHIEPGYDGVYGVVRVFEDREASAQSSLF